MSDIPLDGKQFNLNVCMGAQAPMYLMFFFHKRYNAYSYRKEDYMSNVCMIRDSKGIPHYYDFGTKNESFLLTA